MVRADTRRTTRTRRTDMTTSIDRRPADRRFAASWDRTGPEGQTLMPLALRGVPITISGGPPIRPPSFGTTDMSASPAECAW